MTVSYRRAPRERPRTSVARLASLVLGLLLLAGLWHAVRPGVLYRLARMNLGNARCAGLIGAAIVARHPEHDRLGTASNPHPWYPVVSFNTGRRATAITCPAQVYPPEYVVLDDRLDPIAMVRTTIGAGWPFAPDDRDGDGMLDLLHVSWDFRRSGSGAPLHIFGIVRLGRSLHTLLAVVEVQQSGTGWCVPVWTNVDGDAQHELEFVASPAGRPAPAPQVALKLRWLAPGRMTYDGSLPAGFRVWLANDSETVTFAPSESLDDVEERLLSP